MAIYTFDTMTQTDATAFAGATDYIGFGSDSVSSIGVTDTAATSSALGSTNETITLTDGSHSLTFLASEIATATSLTPEHLVFNNGDALYIGLSGSTGAPIADTIAMTSDTAGHGAIAYGFAGDDHITANVGNDTVVGGDGDDVITGSSGSTDSHGNFTESDYYLGGAGDDLITGGNGNDHIYGNVAVGAAGSDDGNDTINAGDGNDYVNGNAGNDQIDGGIGNDKLFGGAGNDVITGGDGNDSINGNKGEDQIDGGNGNDTLHGGADNDFITHNGAGNGQLFGDNGDDTLVAGNGFDTLTGGAGNDLFAFNTDSALNTNVGVTGADHDHVAWVADFTSGDDVIALPITVTSVITESGATFSTVQAAQNYAETALEHDASSGEVAAITVGTDTYLFYSSTGTVDATHHIDSVIAFHGVASSVFDSDGGDFI